MGLFETGFQIRSDPDCRTNPATYTREYVPLKSGFFRSLLIAFRIALRMAKEMRATWGQKAFVYFLESESPGKAQHSLSALLKLIIGLYNRRSDDFMLLCVALSTMETRRTTNDPIDLETAVRVMAEPVRTYRANGRESIGSFWG